MAGSVRRPAAKDLGAWQNPRDVGHCPICRESEPLDLVAELAASWVTAPRSAPLPGYACVVARRHVVEPFELPADERVQFWEDVLVVAKALTSVFHPIKMNCEIHGNTIPHLHVHLFPRFRGDPFEGGPIDPRIASFSRSSREIARIRSAVIRSARLVGGRRTRGRGDESVK